MTAIGGRGGSAVGKSDSLPQKLNSMVRNEVPQGSTLPVTPPPSMCPSSASFEDGEKLDNLVHVKINDTTTSSSTNGAARKHRNIDVDFNTLDIVFSLQSWVIILDFFGIGSPKANQAPAQYVELSLGGSLCVHTSTYPEVHLYVVKVLKKL